MQAQQFTVAKPRMGNVSVEQATLCLGHNADGQQVTADSVVAVPAQNISGCQRKTSTNVISTILSENTILILKFNKLQNSYKNNFHVH